MRFYGSGIVWDKEKKRRLCKFVGGQAEIDDPRAIEILKKAGYRSDQDGWKTEQRHGEGPETESKPVEEKTFNELRAEAKEKGIEGYGKMTKQELLEALRE